MDKAQPDDHPAIQDLLKLVNSTEDRGLRSGDTNDSDADDGEYAFIPRTRLQAYLGQYDQVEKLLSALFGDEDPMSNPPDAGTIRQSYSKIFCILIAIGKGRFINHFIEHGIEDRYLPFQSHPGNFPSATSDSSFFTTFYQQQWKFCVPELHKCFNKRFDANEWILPIKRKEELDHGGSAATYKIEVHEAYDQLHLDQNHRRDSGSPQGSGCQRANFYVLKSYRKTRDAEQYYNSECTALKRLNYGGHCRNIIGFYGSFRLNKTFNILLEYADKGTLNDYLASTPPPCTGTDIVTFWKSFVAVTLGLARIHGTESTTEGPQIVQGWHQDIKPANILVKSREGKSVYDFECKLADLGLSHFKKNTSLHAETIDVDTRGTRAYGAPECYRFDTAIDTYPLPVKQSIDVWSLGCVFSEVVTWVARNWDAVLEYRQQRKRETQRILGFRDGDCFHDGKDKLLNTVDENHAELVRNVRACDHVTKPVLEMIKNDMLRSRESYGRRNANYLCIQSTQLIQEAEKVLGETKLARPSPTVSLPGSDTWLPEPRLIPPEPPQDSTQPISRPAHPPRLVHNGLHTSSGYTGRNSIERQGNQGCRLTSSQAYFEQSESSNPPMSTPTVLIGAPKSREPPPVWPLRAALQWRSQKKDGKPVNISHEHHHLASLKKRDHAFLIDDASSMKSHWPDVRELLGLLGYILKSYDQNGLDLYFTSSNKSYSKVRTSSNLLAIFDQKQPHGKLDMSERLGSIVSEYQRRLNKQHTKNSLRAKIGQEETRPLSLYVFTDGTWQPDCDVASVIRSMVDSLDQHNLLRTQVGIQFIRFGNRPEGIERLTALDTGLKLNKDIVDTEPSDGNVIKMLLGSINRWFDDDVNTINGTAASASVTD